MNHPLLNPDSKHYSMVDGVEAITRLEEMYPKEMEKIRTYEAYYEYLTVERSDESDKLLKLEIVKSHKFTCMCEGCKEFNANGNKLFDEKRRYKQEVKDDTTKTSKESHEEVIEKTLKALFGNSIRRAKVGEDSELPESCPTHVSHARDNPKIRIIRYIQGSILDELIGGSDTDKLSSSEEPFKVTEVQGDSNRRGSPMDRRISEDVSAMERFEGSYAKHSRDLQLGYIDARNFRELISNAFAEFMESVGQVSNGQGGLAVQ